MSRTLNLIDHLRERGQKFQKLGRDRDACQAWKRLAGFHGLPVQLQEEAQVGLAELRLKRRQFQRARRHLTAALLYQPDSARYHYLMAQALNTVERGDPDRAAEHYRRALELDPNQPLCRAEYGVLLVDLGNLDEGVAALQQACEGDNDDPKVLALVVEGLCLAERPDEARHVLRSARFRHPHDRGLVKLWNDMQYDQLHEEQNLAPRERPRPVADEEPTLLAFVRPTEHQVRLRVRRDPPQPLPARIGRGVDRKPGMFSKVVSSWFRWLGGSPCFRIWGRGRRELDWRVIDVFATHRRDFGSRWPLWRGTCITWSGEVIAVGWDFARLVLHEQRDRPASRQYPVDVAGGRLRDWRRRLAAGAGECPSASEILAHECGHTAQVRRMGPLYWPIGGAVTLFREGPHFWNRFENQASEEGQFGGIVTGSVCPALAELLTPT